MAVFTYPSPDAYIYPPPSGGGGSNTVDVEDEGSAVATASVLNFVGAGVTATDAGGGTVDVTIPGASNSLDIEDEGGAVATAVVLNFVGAGVTATDAGGGQVNVTIPGGAGEMATVETRTISAPEAAAKQLTIGAAPLTAAYVVLDVAGAPAQMFGVDYTVSGSTLDWNGLGLDGILAAGDVIRLVYQT